MKEYIYSCLIILFVFCSNLIFSQKNNEQGNPFIKNYSYKDYSGIGQNWAIIQDSRGIMYFGNGDKGVMEYDGETFIFIPVSNNSTVLSLDIDKNDKIYVGAVGEFGYLEPDSIGRLIYKSYLNRIDSAQKNFTDVWATHCTDDGVYYLTKNILFFINDTEVKTWYPEHSSFFLAYLVNKKLYVLEYGYGLLEMKKNNKLGLVYEGDRFKNESIYSIEQLDSRQLLISTRNQGLIIYDSVKGYSHFPTEIDDFLKNNFLYTSKILHDKKIVIGTLTGGVAVINKEGKLIQFLNKNSGLIDEVIYSTFIDKESNLWLGLSHGISKVEVNHPITRFNEKNGLSGSIHTINKHNGILYVGTYTGTYYLKNGQFYKVHGIADQSWKLTKFTPAGSDKTMLLVGTYTGIYEIQNNKSKLVKKLSNCQNIYVSKKFKNRLYVIAGTHITILEYNNNVWKNIGIIPGLNTYMESIAEDNDGSLWICSEVDGIYHLILKNQYDLKNIEIIKYDLEDGIPDLSDLRIFEYENNLLIGTQEGLYKFNSKKNRFIKEKISKKISDDELNAYYIFSKTGRNLWISDHQNNNQQIGYYKNIEDNPIWYDIPFKRLPKMYIYALYNDSNNITWIGGSELLFKYDANLDNIDYKSPYNTLIRKVTIGQDSVICRGTFNYNKTGKQYKQAVIHEIEYKNNSITFNFSAAEFSNKENLVYQHYLEGYNKKWSSFSNISHKEYTNLPKGKYTFKVRAKNTYGQIGNEAYYRFIILTPWYSSILAYIIYSVLLTLLIFIIVKFNIKRLKKHNKNLEQLVKNRTYEISIQKEEILAQSDHLLKVNEELKKLSIAIEQSPLSVVITDTKGDIEFANSKFTEITGYSLEEIKRKNLNILKSGKQDNEFYKDLWQTITNGNVWKGEFHNKKKNGELYWENATISPVRNTKGKITHFITLKEDITNKKLIQKRLIESEKHFREIFEKSLIGMYQTTPGGKIIRANKVLYEMLGYNSLAELKEINLETEKGYVNNRNEFKEKIEIYDYVVGFESVWTNKNGKPIYVRESARKYLDEKGKVFYEGTIENITDWKLTDKALKEMHSFNETIIKAGKLGYATFSINGKCLSANESYAEIVGGTLDQIMAQNFRKIENWKKTDLLTNAEKCLKEGVQIKRIIDAESTFNKHIWIEIFMSRIKKDNNYILLVIIKDISSLIRAKKRQLQTKSEYINLIENVNVPVFGIDKKGKINEWNTTIEELSGYKRDDIKGRNFVKHFIDKNEYNSYNFIKDSMTGIEISNIEFNLFTKNHKNLKLLVSTTIRRNIYNEIDGIICVGQDITKIDNYKIELEKKVEERTHKLIDALKKEKELGDLKSQFVSMASHEFRTPLAAISFAAGFIKKYWRKIDDKVKEQKLEKIEKQIKHMTNLLDDVLTFGRAEGAKIKLEPVKINITEFLNLLIEEVQNVTKNSHEIKFDFDHKICYIIIDEKVAGSIFTNLLTNAIKFSPDAGHVDLKLISSDSVIIIEIIDYGIGINPKELEHIFTPFHRGKNVQTIQGTGLGLAIVKESVDILKGTITVKSKIGIGTKFTITLPKTI